MKQHVLPDPLSFANIACGQMRQNIVDVGPPAG